MKLENISNVLHAEVLCGQDKLPDTIDAAFASDLMSNVLSVESSRFMLITGLSNIQTIRTAELFDIKYIIFAHNKQLSKQMIELADENNMCLLLSPFSVYKICGILYSKGLNPVF